MSVEVPPPEHLSERAVELWTGVVDDYELGAHQVELLRRACEAADRADEARKLLEAEGLMCQDRYGQLRPHPAAAIERDSRIAEARLLRELALEPGPAEENPRPPRTGASATGKASR